MRPSAALRAGLAAGFLLAGPAAWAQAARPLDVPVPPRRPADLDDRPARAPQPPAAPGPATPPPRREVFGPAMPARPAKPAAMSGAGTPAQAGPVAAGESCTDGLKGAGVVFTPARIGPQPDPRCVIAEPVTLSGLDPADGLPIDFPDRPTVGCATARVFADYLRTLLVPLARGQFGSAVAAVGTGPGFDCRTRDHIPGAKISAHGLGLAVDIAEIRLADGRRLDIGHPADAGERAFDTGARAGACGFFHTALGPGADSFHESHWHFDLLPRGPKGDTRLCQ